MSEVTDTPGEPTDPKLLDHDYDGIRELDNDPPLWFSLLFLGTVGWAIVYFCHFALGPGAVGQESWKKNDVVIQELKAKNATGPLSEEQLRALSTNPERIAAGAKLFTSANCAACHGPEALGLVGPNLRDKFWIHGSQMTQIVTLIANGSSNLLMPAQKSLLSGDDINNLVIYIVSLNRAGFKDGKAIDPTQEKEEPITY